MNNAVANNINEKNVSAIIVAAGTSSRMQGIDKQLLDIGGMPVIARAVFAFQKSDVIKEIIIVTREEVIDDYKIIAERFEFSKVKAVVKGGNTRQESVFNGISACSENAEYIAIHDGARPFVSQEVIKETVEKAICFGAAAAAITAKDTIKIVNDKNFIAETVDRNTVRQMQTPQVFEKNAYLNAMKTVSNSKNFTDDCMLMESAGVPVFTVESSPFNIKITTPEDIVFAEAIIRREKMIRIGHGYDVHKLVENRKLILGGVEIENNGIGLLGHSDADVLLHAISDSLLGAAALGDIGKYFPDTDEKYKNANSLDLLKKVNQFINDSGYSVVNIDATVLAQSPKLAPHILKMRENIANALSVHLDAVSVKATTEEGLGFTGSRDGIAAHAVALIEK